MGQRNSDKSCSSNDWEHFGRRLVCRVHETFFGINEKCPLVPQETSSTGNVAFSDNKIPPNSSHGIEFSKKSGLNQPVDAPKQLTPKEEQALKLSNQDNPKLTLVEIGKILKVKKQRVHFLINRARKKLNILINDPVDKKGAKLTTKKRGQLTSDLAGRHKLRWHDDEFEIDIEPISFVNEKTSKLKYTEYKNIDDVKYHIQVFSRKITITLKDDLTGFDRNELIQKADKRIKFFLKNLDLVLKQHLSGDINIKEEAGYIRLKRHWAIMDTAVAKKYVKEGKKLFIYDRVDGKLRKSIDFSHGKAEFEDHHLKHGDADVRSDQSFFDDLTYNPHDLPSKTKERLDVQESVIQKASEAFLKVAEESTKQASIYAEQNKVHFNVLDGIKQSNERTAENINKLIEVVSILKKDVSEERLIKVQKLKRDFGW